MINRATWTTINFPVGLFSAPPIVMVQGNGTDTAPSHYAVTKDSFQAWIAGTGTATADWIAIQV